MANKSEELEIIKKIYKDDNYVITPSEKPDFLIRKKHSKKVFGAEVTKLYYSQSSARLKIIPNYREKLLKDGIPRRDQGELGKHELYVMIEGKWVYLADTIDQKFKNYDDYINAIVKTIKDKNEKLKNYKKLDYYELFIDDKEQFLKFKDIRDIQKLWESSKLQETFKNTPFSRIYLFTVINGRDVMYMMGDIMDSPLNLDEKTIEIQKEYLSTLFKSNKKE